MVGQRIAIFLAALRILIDDEFDKQVLNCAESRDSDYVPLPKRMRSVNLVNPLFSMANHSFLKKHFQSRRQPIRVSWIDWIMTMIILTSLRLKAATSVKASVLCDVIRLN